MSPTLETEAHFEERLDVAGVSWHDLCTLVGLEYEHEWWDGYRDRQGFEHDGGLHLDPECSMLRRYIPEPCKPRAALRRLKAMGLVAHVKTRLGGMGWLVTADGEALLDEFRDELPGPMCTSCHVREAWRGDVPADPSYGPLGFLHFAHSMGRGDEWRCARCIRKRAREALAQLDQRRREDIADLNRRREMLREWVAEVEATVPAEPIDA